MSERDCGKWYCQKAAGHRRLRSDEFRLYPGKRAASDNARELDDERRALTGHVGPPARSKYKPLGGWFGEQREAGFTGWLAAYSHGNGTARHYWTWDPDSRGQYMEAHGPYGRGEVPADIGDLHRGLGWQLPIVAIMTEEPSAGDLVHLQDSSVPYFILEETVVEPPVDPPPSDGDPWIFEQWDVAWSEAGELKYKDQVLAKLDVLFTVGKEIYRQIVT